MPPSAENLKYLAFKNHGVLLLSDLKHERADIDPAECAQRVEIVLDEFAEALLYSPSDDIFLTLVAALARRLGYLRIARLAYECVAVAPASSGTGLQSVLDTTRLSSPLDAHVLRALYDICGAIHDDATLASRPQLFARVAQISSDDPRLPKAPDLSFLDNNGESFVPGAENAEVQRIFPAKINLASPDWVSLLSVLQDHVVNLSQSSKSKRKLAEAEEDPYELSVRPSNLVSFNVREMESPAEPEEEPPVEEVKVEEPAPSTVPSSSTTPESEDPVKTKSESSSEPADQQNPPKARSSKRFKADKQMTLSGADFTEDDAFFEQIDTFLKPCSFSFSAITKVFSEEAPLKPTPDLYIYDFKHELQSWDAPQVEIFAAMKAQVEGNATNQPQTLGQPLLAQLLDSPSPSGANSQIPESSRPTTIPPTPGSIAFVRSVLARKPHIQQVRTGLVRALFGEQLPDSDGNSIQTQTWPLAAIKSLSHLVAHIEPLLQEFPKTVVSQVINNDLSHPRDVFSEIRITQTILELIANESFGIAKLLRKPETLTKSTAKDLTAKHHALDERYLSWRRIFSDLLAVSSSFTPSKSSYENIVLRNQWTNLLVSRSSSDTSSPWENNGDDFVAIIAELEAVNPELEISYPNFINIPSFSLASIRNQLSRFRAMATLSEIFKDPVLDIPSPADDEPKEKEDKAPPPSEKKREHSKPGPKPKVTKIKVEKEKDEEKKKREDEKKKKDEEKKKREKEEREQRELEKAKLKERQRELSMEASRKRITMLERILLDDGDIEMDDELSPKPENEYKAISAYLSRASLDLRLKFLNLLLDDYQNVGETQKSLDGYLAILGDIVGELTSENYRGLTSEQRPIALLRAVYLCHAATKNIIALDLSVEGFQKISTAKLRSAMTAIISLLRLLHVYVLFEDGIVNSVIQAPLHAAWGKSADIMKELTVRSWCLFYYLFQALLPQGPGSSETLSDIMTIVHEQLGTRGYCGLADGILLDLILHEVIKFNSDAEMVQCLHCRYNVVVSSEDFHPYDHGTTAIDMDKATALRVLAFVMVALFKKKNLAQSLSRADVKGVLDEFYEAIDFPSSSNNPSISRNAFILAGVMEMRVDVPFLQKCFKGLHPVSFVSTPKEIDLLAKSGLYFLLGQSRLQQFRQRKRSMQGRTEDVSEAIKFLKYDLMCGGYNRFETWYSLAQGYEALAEDDVTWNTDKITMPDSRKVTVARQKKALICTGMAINRLLRQRGRPSELFADTPSFEQMTQSVWPFFARLLFNATQCPMDMAAFFQLGERLLCGAEGLYSREPTYVLRPNVIMKTALLAIKVAENDGADWLTYNLKGQMLHKLRSSPQEVLNTYVTAIDKIPEKQSKDAEAVLEPHYKLVSCVYKYLKAGKITNVEAMEYLGKSLYADNSGDSPIAIDCAKQPENNEAYSLCAAALVKIRGADKKKWHHRPTYRLARIYDETGGDYIKAKEELSAFFQLKTTSKTPIQIWKTEYERPGQHFEYARQYVAYFVDLLERTRDVEMFGILSKCLRKFKSGMLKHQETWEMMCTTIARTLKSEGVLAIPPRYADSVIQRIVFDDFSRNTAKMLAYNEDADTPLHPLTKFLNYTAELRRLNNGFGSTAALDDLFVSLYLLIYEDFVDKTLSEEEQKEKEKELAVASTPLPNPTKISVMDLLSDPVTPESGAQTPADQAPTKKGKAGKSAKALWVSHTENTKKTVSPSANASAAGSSKVRVTRRDIISRSLALLRSTLPKLVATDSLRITKANTPMPSRVASRHATPKEESDNVEDKKPQEEEKVEPAASQDTSRVLLLDDEDEELEDEVYITGSTKFESPQAAAASSSQSSSFKPSISSLLDPDPEPPSEQKYEQRQDYYGAPPKPDYSQYPQQEYYQEPYPQQEKAEPQSQEEGEKKPTSRHSDWFNTIIGKSSEDPIELD